MNIFFTLLFIWFVTLIFYIFDRLNPFWAGLMSFLCFLFFVYEVYIGNYITSLLWVWSGIVWIGTMKKTIKLKRILDEKEKNNREFPGS